MLSNYVIKYCALAALVVGASVLAGCHSSQLGPPHDVAYFKAHSNERKAVIQVCANDPGTYAAESNCMNAFEADKQAMFSAPNTLPIPPDSLVTQGLAPTQKSDKKDKSH